MPNLVEVLILQHPLEVAHVKGTARLLHLSLPHSRLFTGEVFDLPACLALMDAHDASNGGQTSVLPRRNLLLYPHTDAAVSQNLLQPPPLPLDLLPDPLPDPLPVPSQLRLIVLDGTWRKSRKMLYVNPLLEQLPRLSLQGVSRSRYMIRKAHRPGQLSTLEATCAALAQLEGDAGKFEPLLKAFDGFVAQQSGLGRGQLYGQSPRSMVPESCTFPGAS